MYLPVVIRTRSRSTRRPTERSPQEYDSTNGYDPATPTEVTATAAAVAARTTGPVILSRRERKPPHDLLRLFRGVVASIMMLLLLTVRRVVVPSSSPLVSVSVPFSSFHGGPSGVAAFRTSTTTTRCPAPAVRSPLSVAPPPPPPPTRSKTGTWCANYASSSRFFASSSSSLLLFQASSSPVIPELSSDEEQEDETDDDNEFSSFRRRVDNTTKGAEPKEQEENQKNNKNNVLEDEHDSRSHRGSDNNKETKENDDDDNDAEFVNPFPFPEPAVLTETVVNVDDYNNNNNHTNTAVNFFDEIIPLQEQKYTTTSSSSSNSSSNEAAVAKKKDAEDNAQDDAFLYSSFEAIMEAQSSSSSSSTPSTPLVAPRTGRTSVVVPALDGHNTENGIGMDNRITAFTQELQETERAIYRLIDDAAPSAVSVEAFQTNNTGDDGTPEPEQKKKKKTNRINLNSPKQVSQLLFGQPDLSTNKATLEGMAGSNVLAKLILQYRDTKRRLNKISKQQQIQQEYTNDAAAAAGGDAAAAVSSSTDTDINNPRTVWLFDTSSFIFRAYYSNPPIHRSRDGMPIGAVMGFCNMLNKLVLNKMIRERHTTTALPIVIQCLDAPGPSFRKALYTEYKANRPPVPMDLLPQFAMINQACQAYGMIQIQSIGNEADDVIASLATKGLHDENLNIVILSSDKDLMQLVTKYTTNENEIQNNTSSGNEKDGSGGIIQMMDPMTNKLWTYDRVCEKWDVETTSLLGDVLALAGDAADNIPGVPGIGPKIASQLLKEYGSLDNLLSNLDNIPQQKRREKLIEHKDMAILSRELVELKRDLNWTELQIFHPNMDDSTASMDANDNISSSSNNNNNADTTTVPTSVTMSEDTTFNDLRMEPINIDRILKLYDEMNFFTLKKRLLETIKNDKSSNVAAESSSSTSTSSSINRNYSSNSNIATGTSIATESTASSPKNATPKKSSTRKFWEKYKMGIPKPEDYADVPF